MSSNIELNFKKVVEQIFNNWTALQLAIEHDMGGPMGRQTATEVMNWVCNYCLNQNDLQVTNLAEELEDILDEEFSTICEDDSPKEVAYTLIKFLTFLKDGNIEQFESEYISLPTCKTSLSKGVETTKTTSKPVLNQSNGCSTSEHQMDVDSEWTVVQRRKK